jgi:hypothetical protein
MSERALGFVEDWISENVDAEEGTPEAIATHAKALASQCLADANAEGIPASEISESIDDLAAFIAGAIEEANERDEHDDDDDDVLADPEGIRDAADDALEDEDEDEKQ